MSPLHVATVAFATKSVERLRKRKTLTGTQFKELWNQELLDVSRFAESARHGQGHNAMGKAGHCFNNDYFLMPQLHKMDRGELPLPISERTARALLIPDLRRQRPGGRVDGVREDR